MYKLTDDGENVATSANMFYNWEATSLKIQTQMVFYTENLLRLKFSKQGSKLSTFILSTRCELGCMGKLLKYYLYSLMRDIS